MARRKVWLFVMTGLLAILGVLGLAGWAYWGYANQLPAYSPPPAAMPLPNAYADYCAAVRLLPPTTTTPRPSDATAWLRARVRSADNAHDWVEGEVLSIDADEIALLRADPEVGEVAVHFPRLGYDWRRVSAA